jgi:hypothetical protein
MSWQNQDLAEQDLAESRLGKNQDLAKIKIWPNQDYERLRRKV